ncbi:hypothetical protein VB715_17630 [Crocosphaera sp. UHCC 0190]|uniref:hypothetical protein n=1 Tax=Crocosphaera sp. UHCC 0190 TaxID=3110246 RepID=UPI002B1FAE02|nr:hypothetical protein [Crocosphaera sp. UHCC 0190]MEA5511598.1 hypothetical protein [Crocosphaera sp. UHCC 0190]
MAVDEDRIKNVYKLARSYPDDPNLQESVEIIKSLRRSQGALQGWNERYRFDNTQLKGEIVYLSDENSQLQTEVNDLSLNLDSLKSELANLNQEMLNLTQEKARIYAERARVIAELKKIETEVEIATIKAKETKSLYGKFTIIWTLMQSLFFSDDPQDFGKIDNTVAYDPEKPQMAIDPVAIGKDLLDK